MVMTGGGVVVIVQRLGGDGGDCGGDIREKVDSV